MNQQAAGNEKKEIVYSVSFIQRLFNPPFTFVLRISLSFMIICLLLGITRCICYFYQMSGNERFLLPLLCVGFFFFSYMWWGVWKKVFKCNCSNRLIFKQKSFGFGQEEIPYWLPYQNYMVKMGLFRVSLIQDINGSTLLIVPSNFVSYLELKDFFEVN